MKYILIFLLALITLQVQAQTKIIGSTSTASGDVQGTYPTIYVKPNVINRANLTQGLRDSLTRFRHDTIIKHSVDGNVNLGSIVNTLGRYNRVYVLVLGETGFNQGVILPSGADTIRNTEFNITYISEDTLSTCQIAAFDGFAVYYTPPNLNLDIVLKQLNAGSTVSLKSAYISGFWTWLSSVGKNIYGSFFEDATGISALTTDVVASGTGSVTATIQPNAVTSAKILDGTVSLADHASNSVNSSKIVDGSVALADMASNSVDNTKIVDYSITGTDLNYLTLRAGDATNPLIRWTAGAVLTTPVNGTWEWDANKLNFTIGGNRKRIPVFNDAAPTGGQLMIGNGTDFTLAPLTNGYAQTITNGSGTISITPDTTKVIPYIPSGEIGNGTRDGYYKTQTLFGNQFYNGLYIKEDQTELTANGNGLLNVRRLDGSGSSAIQYGVESGNKPYVTAQVTEIDTPTNNKSFQLTQKGFETQVYNSVPSINSKTTTYVITGEYSVEHVDDVAVTSITLPEIVNTSRPVTGKVAPGFMLYLSVNLAAGITINRAGTDVILRDGVIGSTTSISTTGGTTYAKVLIAVAENTWMLY